MSTSYYYFNPPITSVRVDEGPGHDRVTVFIDGKNAGTLIVSAGQGKAIACLFANKVTDDMAPMRTHYGGKGVGCVVTVLDPDLRDDNHLIDEYGRVYTARKIKQLAGRGA